MNEEINILSSSDPINKNISGLNINFGVMKIQNNLLRMGFDITMVNKIISNFQITSEQQAIDYLIKTEDGMWNHPFIPKEEDPNDQRNNILNQPKNVVSNVFTKINSIKRTTTFSARKSIINAEEVSKIVNEVNNNSEKLINDEDKKKIVNENICEICGEEKEFHNIKEFNVSSDAPVEDEKIESNDILDADINTGKNLIISEDNEPEEEDDPNICQICMDEFDNPQEMETCRHKFCLDCFHSYLVDRITNNQIEKIPCPKKKCKNQNLSENFFSKYLSEQESAKYHQFKKQNEIANDKKKVFCPLCDSYANITEDEAVMLDSNNPDYIKTTLKCQNGHEFCSCGRPTHEGDCYRDEKEFKDLLIKEDIKKCPKCGFLIKKNKGCNHMTCGNPNCKHQFCWLCMKEYNPEHFETGPCAGKQFFDPDSFDYQLQIHHPCLYYLYKAVSSIFFLIIFVITCMAVPGIALSIMAFGIIFLEEDDILEDVRTSVRVIMFLSYVCFGFAYQTIVYIAWGIVLAGIGLFIGLIALRLVLKILQCILCCQCGDNNFRNDNIENHDNGYKENPSDIDNNV